MPVLDIKKMNTTERLETIELLWDALCHDEQDIPSPAWHEDILTARKQRIDSGTAAFYTLDQLKERLRR